MRRLSLAGWIATAPLVVGLAISPRAMVMSAGLSLGLHLLGARRVALVALVVLTAAGIAGLRIDSLPAAQP